MLPSNDHQLRHNDTWMRVGFRDYDINILTTGLAFRATADSVGFCVCGLSLVLTVSAAGACGWAATMIMNIHNCGLRDHVYYDTHINTSRPGTFIADSSASDGAS